MSTAGQDLRMPALGGTKFPTGDSVTPAKQKFQKSVAEVGPLPVSSPRGATLDDSVAAPKPRQKWASIGENMDPMLTDPLVLYLKKTAAEASTPPLTKLVDAQGILQDNKENLPANTTPGGTELTSQCPKPTPHMVEEGVTKETKVPLDYLFDNKEERRKKYTEKDKPFVGFDQGVVDRVLGL